MKVKIVQRKNPQKPDEPGKFYGQPVLDGVVGMDMICRQIAGRSSLTAGDVKNVLTNFLDELPTYMLMNARCSWKISAYCGSPSAARGWTGQRIFRLL